MIKSIVFLDEPEREAIQKLAERERRDPRMQGGLIIREWLESRGLLVDAPGLMGTAQTPARAGGANDSRS